MELFQLYLLLKGIIGKLGSGLSPQSCIYLQSVHGSKLLNGCLVVWPSNLFLRGIQQLSGFKIAIYNYWFYNFPNNAIEAAEFWWIVGLRAILCLLQRKNSDFFNL